MLVCCKLLCIDPIRGQTKQKLAGSWDQLHHQVLDNCYCETFTTAWMAHRRMVADAAIIFYALLAQLNEKVTSVQIQPCPMKHTHPWEECCYAHPHENARRRDPRKYQYIAEPCPDYKRGICLLVSLQSPPPTRPISTRDACIMHWDACFLGEVLWS
jgi:hypothetical protein